MRTGGFSLGIKRPGREADHSLPSSVEIKNAWSYTSTPPVGLHDVVLRKALGQLYLIIIIIIIIVVVVVVVVVI
jgi:hypothetical protein